MAGTYTISIYIPVKRAMAILARMKKLDDRH